MNDWLLAQRDRRQLPVTPAAEYASLTAQRERAEATGDTTQIERIDQRLDQLFATVRQSTDDEKRQKAAEASAMMRFSSGTRKPLKRKLPPGKQMDQHLLRLTGRLT